MQKLLLTTTVLIAGLVAGEAMADASVKAELGEKPNVMERTQDGAEVIWNNTKEKTKEAGEWIEDKVTTSDAEKLGNEVEDVADDVSDEMK